MWEMTETQEQIEECLCDDGIDKDFSDRTQTTLTIKEKKIDKWNFIKGKNCCFSKTVFSKRIGKLQRGKTYLPNIYQMKTNIQDLE